MPLLLVLALALTTHGLSNNSPKPSSPLRQVRIILLRRHLVGHPLRPRSLGPQPSLPLLNNVLPPISSPRLLLSTPSLPLRLHHSSRSHRAKRNRHTHSVLINYLRQAKEWTRLETRAKHEFPLNTPHLETLSIALGTESISYMHRKPGTTRSLASNLPVRHSSIQTVHSKAQRQASSRIGLRQRRRGQRADLEGALGRRTTIHLERSSISRGDRRREGA